MNNLLGQNNINGNASALYKSRLIRMNEIG
jgi:hypothetical protein